MIDFSDAKIAEAYETGYREGGDSVLADLELAVDEEGDDAIKAFFARFERRREA